MNRRWLFVLAAMAAAALVFAEGRSEKTKAVSAAQTDPVVMYKRAINNIENLVDNEKVRLALEQASGVKLKCVAVPQDAYKDKINILIASGEPFDSFDFTGFGGFHWSSFSGRGAIKSLNELIASNAPNFDKLAKAEGAYRPVTDKDGKIWALPRRESFPQGFVPSIRTDWLKKLNMKNPETIEELEAYFQAVLDEDVNGNGDKNDEIPYIPSWGFGGIESNFKPYFVGETSERFLDKKTGKIVHIWTHPGYRAMLAKMREWFAKGYLFREFYTVKSNQINNYIQTDKLGYASGWYNGVMRPTLELQKINAQAEYQPAAPLKNAPSGFIGYASNPRFSAHTMVPSTSKNAAFLIKYVDWMFASTDNYFIAHRGIKGDHWSWKDESGNVMTLAADQATRYGGYYAPLEFWTEKYLPAIPTEDPYHKMNNRFQAILRKAPYTFLEPFDSFIPYSDIGTPAEKLTGDGKTLIEETRIKVIIGELSLEDWDKTIAKYNSIEGDIRSQVWTAAYDGFIKK